MIVVLLAGCYKIPSDYSEVVYQQAIFTGESVDTTFVSADSGYLTFHGGDTFYFNVDSLRYPSGHCRGEKSTFKVMQHSVFFDLTKGDHFFVNVLIRNKRDTAIIPGFNKADVKIVDKEIVYHSGYLFNIIYTFSALRSSKDAINFQQYFYYYYGKPEEGVKIYGGTIWYCIDVSDSVRFKTDSLSWSLLYKNGGPDSTDTSWYFNRFVMNGNSDASQIFIVGAGVGDVEEEEDLFCLGPLMHTDTVVVQNGQFSVGYNRNWEHPYDVWRRPEGDHDYVPENLFIKVVLRGTKGPDPSIYIECPRLPVK